MNRAPKWLRDAEERIVLPPATDGPSMLYWDIETAPQQQYAWGSGKWDTRPLKVTKPRYHLGFVYGWEPPTGEPFEKHWVSLDQNPNFKPDYPHTKPKPGIDNWVIGELWHLFNVADITIAHNGKRFDTKRTNARILTHPGIVPYAEPYQIDTLLEYRKVAAFPSNSLNELAREIGIEGKYHHPGIDMWWGCMEGDPYFWNEMRKYNLQDVETLRNVFLRVQPWTKAAVNAMSYVSMQNAKPIMCTLPGCADPTAGVIGRGPRPSRTGLMYQRWQCKGCGGYSQSRYADREYSDTINRRK